MSETQDSTLAQWDEAAQPETSTTLEQMDQLVKDLRQAQALAEEAQEEADELKAQYNAKRELVLKTLRANNRTNYSVPGVGAVHITEKEVYRVPKTNEEKNLLFTYIKDKYGPEALMSMVGIHSATLTSWANEESEKGVMSIPGLEAPTMVETLNVRKKA